MKIAPVGATVCSLARLLARSQAPAWERRHGSSSFACLLNSRQHPHIRHGRSTIQPLRNYLKIVKTFSIVITAKAGIQVFRGALDPGFRRGDDMSQF